MITNAILLSTPNYKKVAFTGEKPERKRIYNNRNATLIDLYEMEDRINARNDKLIKKQNELIGNTLKSLANLIYMAPLTDSSDLDNQYSSTVSRAECLINNGVTLI